MTKTGILTLTTCILIAFGSTAGAVSTSMDGNPEGFTRNVDSVHTSMDGNPEGFTRNVDSVQTSMSGNPEG